MCAELEELTLGDGVTALAAPGLLCSEKLSKVYFGKGLTYIAPYVLSDVLPEKLEISEENPKYKIVDGMLLSKDGTVLYHASRGVSGVVTVPEGVTVISENAFFECEKITKVCIPDGVTEIPDCAFYFCTALENVQMSDGVTHIGSEAFDGCASLTAAPLPKNLTSLGRDVFYGCVGLKTATIPDGVEMITQGMFSGCENM